jgi:hypothetical protein
LGGGGSYNFLGDPAVDISMDSYDEFIRENAPGSSVAIADVKTAATSRIHLNLKDNDSIYLQLIQADGSISGRGNLTQSKETWPVEAVGMLQENRLSLDVTASGGELYKFSLAREGSAVIGDYSEILPDGRRINGTAEGKWDI